MATGVQIEVHTEDAAPDAAPYRISRRTGHTVALVKLTLEPTSDTYYSLRLSRASRREPAPMVRRGLVCGIDRCGPERRTLVSNGGLEIEEDITVGELNETVDGDYTFNVHYLTNGGWG